MSQLVQLVFLSSLLIMSMAQAQQSDLVERTFTGVSKETVPQVARKDIQDQAFQQVSEEIIRDLIGNDHFLKKKTLIQSKIIKNAAKYIPVQKPSSLTQDGEQYAMSINMKISIRDLKALLQSNGLMAENDSAPIVLPLIVWNDRVNGDSFRWWSSDRSGSTFLPKESRELEEALAKALQKNGFYSLKPTESGLGQQVPQGYQSERLSSEELQFVSRYFNSSLALDGQIVIEKEKGQTYRIEMRVAAVQVQNGRTIADVSRRFVTETGSSEIKVSKKLKEVLETAANDLSGQILEAWQRGSIGTSIIRVSIQGRTSLPQKEAFKEKVRSQLTQVKLIRERFVSSEWVSFEIDSSTPPAELVKSFEKLDIGGRSLSRVSDSSQEIVLRWVQ